MNYKQRYVDGFTLHELNMITGVIRVIQANESTDVGLDYRQQLQSINNFNIKQRQKYQEKFHMTFPISISMDISTSEAFAYYAGGTVISDGRLNCRPNHPWYQKEFSNITQYISCAFDNIVIRAILDNSSTLQKYYTPFGVMSYFKREHNGSFMGFERSFNNIIFKKYDISKDTIKDIYHVNELNGDWPYGTEKQIFDLIDYINRNCYAGKSTIKKSYDIIQLKNKKYIAKFVDRTLSQSEINILRSDSRSNGKGVFPEFEKKEDLEDVLKKLFN